MNYTKSKKLFIILSILTLISLFGVAAVCNMCGAKPDTTDTTDENGDTADTTDKPSETTDGPSETTSGDLKEPTIKLEISEGPEYSEESGVCYYRIEAKVKGNPKPKVEFSKDDSGGSLGDYICQVNLEDPSDTYTLVAVAKNSEGTDEDTIDLSWGCDEEGNNDPVVNAITITSTEDRFYIDSACTLDADATDPDGDSLAYTWEVTGGTLADPDSKNTIWTMPSSVDSYTVKLTVTDDKGGEDSKSEEINVVKVVYKFMDEAADAYWITGAGNIPFDGATDDDRGFAKFQNDIILEDGLTYTRVLQTHPRWTDDGWISGLFPNLSEYIHIPGGAFFKAKIGFIDGSDFTDGAFFKLYCVDDTSTWYRYPSYEGLFCINDGALTDLNIDLSAIAGKNVQALLQVDVGGNSSQDWAVWVDPIITK